MPVCHYCDTNNPEGVNFCSNCGARLTDQQTGAATTPLTSAGQPIPQQAQPWAAPAHEVQASSPGGMPAFAPPPAQSQPGYQQPPIQVVITQTASPSFNAAPAARSHKSVFLALVLTLLFGPLGMFYSTAKGAIIMLIASIIIGAASSGVGLIFTQIVCVIWGMIAADAHNKGG